MLQVLDALLLPEAASHRRRVYGAVARSVLTNGIEGNGPMQTMMTREKLNKTSV